jgi:phospholipid transport system substrate-binding protein
MSPRSLLLAGLLIAALVAPVAAAAPDPSTARETVARTIEQVFEVIQDKEASTPERVERIERIADPHFDWDLMARLVLARNWPKLTPEQRREFQDEFRRHLRLTYGKRLETYSGESIEVGDARAEANGDASVMTTVRGGRFEGTKVAYRMRARDGNWLVIDVIIEGVSLISNFRAQIQEIVSSKGVEQLIDTLRAKRPDEIGVEPKSAKGGS